jgi:hypothetical protein
MLLHAIGAACNHAIELSIDDQLPQVWKNQTIWFHILEYPVSAVSEQE